MESTLFLWALFCVSDIGDLHQSVLHDPYFLVVGFRCLVLERAGATATALNFDKKKKKELKGCSAFTVMDDFAR